jgi:hypothetical protein
VQKECSPPRLWNSWRAFARRTLVTKRLGSVAYKNPELSFEFELKILTLNEIMEGCGCLRDGRSYNKIPFHSIFL